MGREATEGPRQGCQPTIVPCRYPSPALSFTARSHTDGSQAWLDRQRVPHHRNPVFLMTTLPAAQPQMQGCQSHGLSSLGEASGESLLWMWTGFPSEALLPALTSGTSWGWGHLEPGISQSDPTKERDSACIWHLTRGRLGWGPPRLGAWPWDPREDLQSGRSSQGLPWA